MKTKVINIAAFVIGLVIVFGLVINHYSNKYNQTAIKENTLIYNMQMFVTNDNDTTIYTINEKQIEDSALVNYLLTCIDTINKLLTFKNIPNSNIEFKYEEKIK